MTTTCAESGQGRSRLVSSVRSATPMLREAAILVSLFVVYSAARMLRADDPAAAFADAYRLLELQRALHLPAEQDLQALVLPAEQLVRLGNTFYASAHFPVTAAVLGWLFLLRPAHYPPVRRALVGATAAALVVYLLVPVAPPRMLPHLGFVDTAVVYEQSVYASPLFASWTNQYAALPSLHVGWAVLVAIACVAAGRSRWRWLWVAHPVVTTLVVVVSGNHYWLDAVAGAALVVLAYVLARLLPRLRPEVPAPG